MEVNKVAKYWEKAENNKVICHLCPHNCKIGEENTGVCHARKNIGGTLYTLNYALISSIAFDPIEKKPLFHFYPGTNILSVGTFGCNLKCSFCQNWTIAQEMPDLYEVKSQMLIDKAKEHRNCIGIAFTYNEPSIWYEFVYDTCIQSRASGLKNVLVTNGFINEEPLRDILPYVDAMNIDVKSFTEKYYGDICKGRLQDVKRTVEIAVKSCHVEITTLVLPSLNDRVEEIGELAKWLAGINPDIPLHLSRYFPNYKMNLPSTPKETLYAAEKEAKKYLKSVYLGNI